MSPKRCLPLLALALFACGNDGVGAVKSPVIVVTPGQLVFDSLAIGESQTRPLTVRNEGEGDLILTAFEFDLTTDFVSVPFSERVTIAPFEQEVFSVTYAPTDPSRTSGSLVIVSNDKGNERYDVPVDALAPAPLLEVAPNPVDFGIVAEDTVNEQEVQIRNNGTAPLVICDLDLVGGADFAENIDEQRAAAGLTGEAPIVIATSAGDTATGLPDFRFTLSYAPQSPGADSAQIRVAWDRDGDLVDACTDEEGIAIDTIEVQGEAGTPLLQLSPCPVDFGESSVNFTSRESLTMRNVGTLPLEIYDIRIDERRSSRDFELESLPALPLSLAAGEGETSSDVVVVAYTPSNFEADAGILEVEHSDGAGGRTVTSCQLAGIGVPNDCPVAVPRGRIQEDLQGRQAQEISWAIPLQTLFLDGTQSFDPNGDELTYQWTLTEQPEGAVNGLIPFSGAPTNPGLRQYFIPIAGRYEVELVVTDPTGCSSEPAKVTVLAVPDEALSVELLWYNPTDPNEDDREGADVDLHMVKLGAGAWFDSVYDVYYANKEPNWRPELPSLDIDDTDGGGPETTQLNNPTDCEWYAIGAHYFRQTFGTAYATVRIYINGTLSAEFVSRPLRNTDDFWDVARIHWPTGTVFEVDEIIENFDSHAGIVPGPTGEMEAANLCGDF